MTLQEIKTDIMDSLANVHCYSISQLYGFDGYWKTMDEAADSLSPEVKDNLKELWGFMNSISVEDIESSLIEKTKAWMLLYTAGNRMSSTYRECQRDIYHAEKIAKSSKKYLKRTTFFVGCHLGYFNKEEIEIMIAETIKREMEEDNKVQGGTPKGRRNRVFSNTIFRLEKLRTYLVNSLYLKLIDSELRNQAEQYLEFNGIKRHKIKINRLSFNEVIKLVNIIERKGS